MSRNRQELHRSWDAITLDQLRASGRRKWQGHQGYGAGIAEMDFPGSADLQEALLAAVRDGLVSYPDPSQETRTAEACAEWMASRFGWEVSPGQVHSVNDVLRVLEIVIERVVRPTKVVVPVPSYPPFLQIPRSLGVPVVEVPTVAENGRQVLDVPRIGDELSGGGALLLLCNPANPTGTVYTASELTALSEQVERSRAFVFSDEIHAPLVYSDARHVPYASVSAIAANHSITATSAAKGWNFAGLKCAQVIFTRESDNDAWDGTSFATTHSASTLGLLASAHAFERGAAWLDDAVDYLDHNRSIVGSRLRSIAGVEYSRPEATYLAWIDFGALELAPFAAAFVRDSAGIDVSDGDLFGPGYRSFVRLNFATPRPVLESMLDQLAAALSRPTAQNFKES